MNCEHCPLIGSGLACPSRHHPRYCDLAARDAKLVRQGGQPRYLDIIRQGGTGEASPVAAKRAEPPKPPTPETYGGNPIDPRLYRHRPRVSAPAKELVVARFREPLDWLDKVDIPAIVYDKGQLDPPPLPPTARHVPLPNMGREAHTYLAHIVAEYETLADLTIFTQADPFKHSPDFLGRIAAEFAEPTCLTVQHLPDHPPDEIKARDSVSSHNGFTVRLGLAPHQRIGGVSQWLNKSIWSYVFDCPEPEPWLFGYGACWAVPRSAIRARPLAFWRWLLREIGHPEACCGQSSFTTPPLNPWAFEALWLYLFSSPSVYPHRMPDDEPPAPVVIPANHQAPTRAPAVNAAQPTRRGGCGCGKNKPAASSGKAKPRAT